MPALPIDNPYQVLTFIAAPAILTNASSVLSLGTSNRFARVVDRLRQLQVMMRDPAEIPQYEQTLYRRQIPIIGQRALLLARAMTWFYIAVGTFAATALISLVGAVINLFHDPVLSRIIIVGSLAVGVGAVASLIAGTSLLVREMWQAQHFFRLEVASTQQLMEATVPHP